MAFADNGDAPSATLPADIPSQSSPSSVLFVPENSNLQLQAPSEHNNAANAKTYRSARRLSRADRLALLRDPPSTKSTLRTNNASSVLPSLSTDRADARSTNGTSARSRIDAILTKSKQTQSAKKGTTYTPSSPPETPRSVCKQLWEEQNKTSHDFPALPERSYNRNEHEQDIAATYQMCERTSSLLDNDEDDVDRLKDPFDGNIEGRSNSIINSNSNNFPPYPSPPRTPTGSRVNAHGLVSILKGCAECGTEHNDYLCDNEEDDFVVGAAGSTPARRRFFHRRFTTTNDMNQPTPPASPGDRTITSRVSFSEELVVRELPEMSSEEKSRRFYSADELRTIRTDAREEKEMADQFQDDVNFFCGDLFRYC